MKNSQLFIEIASSSIPERLYQSGRNTNTTAQILRAEATEGRNFLTIYDLFNDMEDKDAHLYSALQTRKNGILSRNRKIIAASEDPRDQAIARFVEKNIFSIPNLDSALMNLLDAISKGFSVIEIIWAVSDSGNIKINSLKSRFQGRFCFDEKNNLRILDPSKEYISLLNSHFSPSLFPYQTAAPEGFYPKPISPNLYPQTSENPSSLPSKIYGYPVPPKKFLVHTFNPQNENPYGRGLCLKAYWYYWFKKNNLKFWVIFNEKFGSPTIIGKYNPGTPEEEKSKLLDVIESLQNDTGVIIPETIALEFLEAKRSGAVNSYKDLADWCNDEISKLILGQTLTSIEGRRSGSLALGKVHERVRFEYIESDAKALADLLNSTLIKWLVDFNFRDVKVYPRFVVDTSEAEDLDYEIEIDKSLINIGVPLPVKHFYEKYKRPAPLEGEKALRYDDNNLYQYHLQFGVLTINEVRASLGLPPVPWGDTPPAIPESRKKESLIKNIRALNTKEDNAKEEEKEENVKED